jgi:alanine dehydrogenase
VEEKMNTAPTIGFPRMMKEKGEKRVFLPEFIQFLTKIGFLVFIEEGYGSRSGFTFHDYQQANEAVQECSRREALARDYVMVLRSPQTEDFKQIPAGSCLISMLHFPTRPKRVALLKELGIKAISMDSIVNDINLRLVEDMRAVAWNGLEAAFDVLADCFPGLQKPDGEPFKVLIFGAGMVGKHAVEAATKLGNIERNNNHVMEGGLGSIALTVGRNISGNKKQMEKLFKQSDVVVDSAQRRDTSKPIIPNEWIGWLPEHAVVTDLSVDPYTLDTNPPVVRGIEGIPQGSLDKYVFQPDDPDWMKTIPESIPTQNRRATVTCYSWPGIHPEASMRHYAQQWEPLMEVLVEKGYDGLSISGGYFERALYRATLHAWLKHEKYGARPR